MSSCSNVYYAWADLEVFFLHRKGGRFLTEEQKCRIIFEVTMEKILKLSQENDKILIHITDGIQ